VIKFYKCKKNVFHDLLIFSSYSLHIEYHTIKKKKRLENLIFINSNKRYYVKNKIILIFLFFFTIYVYPKDVKIKIIDKELNIVLEGAKVTTAKNNENYVADKDGVVTIAINDDITSFNVIISYPGYQSKKVTISSPEKETIIYLAIENFVEGDELVIEGKKITKNEELGVSKVIDKNQLKASAMSGMVQDVMSAIKTLPGVSYGGGRMGNNNISVRGGDTDGLTTLLDGFIVRYPYQWNGMYSIFSPNVVDSVKFSSGIFSAKNGLATSAIMEVNSITPDEGLKIMSMISLADSELYLQTPLWKNSGLLLGGRFIYYDLVNLMMGGAAKGFGSNLNLNSQYLRDGYFKWFWKPTDRVEWYINGFFGSDGSSMNMNTGMGNTDGISNKFKMNYYNYDTFWNLGFKILPNDKIFIHFFTGYECLIQGYEGSSGYEGSQKYSNEFKNYYTLLRSINPSLPDITGIDGFSINTDSSMKSEQTLHSLQTRGDFDITLHEKIMMSIGGGGIFDFNKSGSSGNMWRFVQENGVSVYKKMEFNSEDEDKQILKTFIYITFNFNIIPDTLKIETGIRIDHNLLLGPGYHLNTYPVPGPRFNLTYTPIKNLKYLESLSFSTGIGLFSKSPDISNITKDMGLKDFDITVSKTLTIVMGTEIRFPLGLNFKIEGYYKYIFDRYYINSSISGKEIGYKIHTDGIGHVGGFDITFEKSFSRWLDGSITYSFIYARLLNPTTDNSNENKSIGGEPVGTWYYPSYHKFHNFNIILNIRPAQWCTITPKFVFSSGALKSETTTEQSYGVLDDGQVAEMYTTKSEYNDNLRDNFNMQFDLKLSFNSFIPRTKVKWEFFMSVENLFVFLYSASRGGSVNLFTGKDQTSSSANYSSQMPIPNIGFKIDF
jgi:hypothetical protein